jgi:hypothetical protein
MSRTEDTALEDVNSLEGTAAYLKISNPDILRRMARNRKIGYLKQGAKYIFTREVIETYLANNTIPQDAPKTGMTDSSRRRLAATN